ncbi:MAG: PAS domain-containing protein [Rhizomicrobium sp.]
MTGHVPCVDELACTSMLVDDPDQVDDSRLIFFLNYWRQKRGEARLPLRKSFVPQEVRGNLPWVIVADALPDYTDFRFRVVGSEISQYFLADGVGKTVREAFARTDGPLADAMLLLYWRACFKRMPLRLTGPAGLYNDFFHPGFDAIFLPYSSDGELADRIVNIFTFNHVKPGGARSAD